MESPPEEVLPALTSAMSRRLRYACFIKCTDIVKNAGRRDHGAALHL